MWDDDIKMKLRNVQDILKTIGRLNQGAGNVSNILQMWTLEVRAKFQ
jgi:hypothetical protein